MIESCDDPRTRPVRKARCAGTSRSVVDRNNAGPAVRLKPTGESPAAASVFRFFTREINAPFLIYKLYELYITTVNRHDIILLDGARDFNVDARGKV